MSCTTRYIVRDDDGAWWHTWDKYGPVLADDPGQARRIAAACRRGRGASPLDPTEPAGLPELWGCQGFLLDRVRRLLRFWDCNVPGPPGAYREAQEHHLRAVPGWRGWQVEVAWGGPATLLDLVPEVPDRASEQGDPADGPADLAVYYAGWVEEDPHAYPGWDPLTRELQVRYGVPAYPWFSSGNGLLSVVADDLTVVDHRMAVCINEGVEWLQVGPALVQALAGRPPADVGQESEVWESAVIDAPARTVRYWSSTKISPRTLRRVTRAWAGWDVVRLPGCYAGHLAATGRPPDDVCLTPDDELLADRHGAGGFGAEWVAWRRCLPVDGRGLRLPTIRIIDDV